MLAGRRNWLGAFVLADFVHAAFAAILFISLLRERREATQRNLRYVGPTDRPDEPPRLCRLCSSATARRRLAGRALLVLDLDHFKQVNDRSGHEVGDRMLIAFAEVAEAAVRPADRLFRMGGEEFCFVLPDTPLEAAIQVAERIRRGFEARRSRKRRGSAARRSASASLQPNTLLISKCCWLQPMPPSTRPRPGAATAPSWQRRALLAQIHA